MIKTVIYLTVRNSKVPTIFHQASPHVLKATLFFRNFRCDRYIIDSAKDRGIVSVLSAGRYIQPHLVMNCLITGDKELLPLSFDQEIAGRTQGLSRDNNGLHNHFIRPAISWQDIWQWGWVVAFRFSPLDTIFRNTPHYTLASEMISYS